MKKTIMVAAVAILLSGCKATKGQTTFNAGVPDEYQDYDTAFIEMKEVLPMEGYEKYEVKKVISCGGEDMRCLYHGQVVLPASCTESLKKEIADRMKDFVPYMYEDSVRGYRGAYDSFQQVVDFYANQLDDYWKSDEMNREMGVDRHYRYQIVPVWTSDEWITFRLFEFSYMGGAHGGYTVYYQTYDKNSGRLLGTADIFDVKKMDDVLSLVGKHLKDSTSLYDSADVDAEVSGKPLMIEEWQGRRFPRPALLADGVVFSYQTYWKGSNTDGDRQVLLPYQEVKDYIIIKQKLQ